MEHCIPGHFHMLADHIYCTLKKQNFHIMGYNYSFIISIKNN